MTAFIMARCAESLTLVAAKHQPGWSRPDQVSILAFYFKANSRVGTVVDITFIQDLLIVNSSLGRGGRSVSLTTDWTTTGLRFPVEAKDFSCSLCVQTSSRSHPASYTAGTGGPFPGGKARPGRDTHHSPLSRAEVKNE
jgi:hypothetical protein